MKVLLVEDDHEQAKDITDQIQLGFLEAEIMRVKNESDFVEEFDNGRLRHFDVVVLDLILRWTDSGPSMTIRPQRVKDEGSDRAGLRCVERLRNTAETQSIPVIMYSVIQREDLEANWGPILDSITYLDKGENHNALIAAIRSAVR